MSDVSKFFRKNTRMFGKGDGGYLTAPFRKRSSDIIKFSNAFFKFLSASSSKGYIGSRRQAVNLAQAIVRNPILRGDYGPNKRSTVRSKGFNRYGIDTAQLFKAITARIVVKGKRV